MDNTWKKEDLIGENIIKENSTRENITKEAFIIKNKGETKFKIVVNNRHKALFISSIIILILVTIYISGLVIHEDKLAPNFSNTNLSPSKLHLFGTDWLGRDIFLRTIKGLSTSITIGFIAASVSAVIATVLGIISAIGSKTIYNVVNWLINLVMGIPHMIFLILISYACGRGMKGILIGIILTHWTSLARIIQGEVLQIRSLHYIAVAKKLGRSKLWILRKHFIPQLLPQFIIGLILTFPHAIIHEASISFLGYGLSPEQPAIGIILSESMKYLSSGFWWLAVYPGITLVVIVLLFDKLGNYFKLMLDPYSANE